MNGITPQIAVLMATMGAGVWMTTAGISKSALEWKRRKRVCPSCGREIPGRVCAHHA